MGNYRIDTLSNHNWNYANIRDGDDVDDTAAQAAS